MSQKSTRYPMSSSRIRNQFLTNLLFTASLAALPTLVGASKEWVLTFKDLAGHLFSLKDGDKPDSWVDDPLQQYISSQPDKYQIIPTPTNSSTYFISKICEYEFPGNGPDGKGSVNLWGNANLTSANITELYNGLVSQCKEAVDNENHIANYIIAFLLCVAFIALVASWVNHKSSSNGLRRNRDAERNVDHRSGFGGFRTPWNRHEPVHAYQRVDTGNSPPKSPSPSPSPRASQADAV